QYDVNMRIVSVVVIDRDPLQLSTEIAFHPRHRGSREVFHVSHARAALGGEHQPEMTRVSVCPFFKPLGCLDLIKLTIIGLAFLPIWSGGVTFQILSMR